MTSRRRPAAGWAVAACVLASLSTRVGTAGVPPAPPACAVETATFSNTTPLALNDETTVTTTIVVSGAQPYVWDVDLETSIQHGYPGDLRIRLTSPEGTVAVITTDSGAGNPEVFHGTVWDDDADPGSQVPYTGNPKIVSDYHFSATPRVPFLVPEGAMAAFIGEDPNGTWTLEIEDDAPGGEGFLESWDLHLTTLPGAPAFVLSDTFDNTTPVPLPDLVVATSTIDVPSGLGGRISNITAQTFIEHEFSADLLVTLTSPAGTVVTLTTGNGEDAADVFDGTVWSDDAPSVASDHVYQNGVVVPALVPEEAMGAFLAEDPAGTWTLKVVDSLANDVGTLQSWSLTITTASCAEASAAGPVAADSRPSGGSSQVNGVLEPGERVVFEPSWTNESASASFSLTGAATLFDGPAGATYTIFDAAADYGTIAPLATANCFDATGNCYELGVDDPAVRPVTHWDATLEEEATPGAGLPIPHAYTVHIGESFTDVPVSDTFYRFIETLFHNAVTGGCGSGTTYCPLDSVTRAQMAVFILKAEHGPLYAPPACAGIFPDVACPSLFADWIEQLAAEGITGGCGGGGYCPSSPVTRQQMAVFLLKGEHGSDYVPPPCSGDFGDVPCPSQFADWIEQLAAEGITGGCGGGNYCPASPVTRGQMAVFLTKTFGLILYGP